MRTRPEVRSSSPAIRRSNVDLPQPEGPTNIANSLSLMSRSTSLMTLTAPNALRTACNWMAPIVACPLKPARSGPLFPFALSPIAKRRTTRNVEQFGSASTKPMTEGSRVSAGKRRSGRRPRNRPHKRKHDAAEMMAWIVAERLVGHLEQAGFVVMKRPPIGGASALGRGYRGR
jgi:hypothetical protein